jgi:hypothetical protein
LNIALLFLAGFAILLLILLVSVLRDPERHGKPENNLGFLEESGRSHATYLRQVQQAMAAEDFDFLAARGSRELSKRTRKERRKIVLAYLYCLRNDFLKLWRLARVISTMSPKVGVGQEFARLRLGLIFFLRYELIRIKFRFGFAPLPELGSLSEVVSRLAMRLETTMRELGERAALAANLASTLDGRRLDSR